MKEKKVTLSIKWKIFGLTIIPLVLLSAVITVFSMDALKKGLKNETIS